MGMVVNLRFFVDNLHALSYSPINMKTTQSKHQILVGNIGIACDTASAKEARSAFNEYISQSKSDYGRAGGETVTWLKNGEIFKEYSRTIKLPLIKDLAALFVSLKKQICDDYRASEDSDDTTPAMSVTIGANEKGEWAYQTGDNSFTGGAYSFPHWSTVTLQRRSNSTELARDVVNELANIIHQ